MDRKGFPMTDWATEKAHALVPCQCDYDDRKCEVMCGEQCWCGVGRHQVRVAVAAALREARRETVDIIADLLDWIEPSCAAANPPDDPCDKGWHNEQVLAIRRAHAYLG